jgi:predicted Fe-Mo cluster-binding NifX family protein
MQKTVDLFSDCQYVAASRIGAGANALLTQKGIVAMALPGDLIEALNKIHTYNEIQNLFN